METPEASERAEYQIHTANWRGIGLEVRHCPCWFSMPEEGFVTQHLEIRTEDKRKLPITATGYRSHFMNGAEALAAFNYDPVEFVLHWFEEAANDPAWKRREEADRQGSLF